MKNLIFSATLALTALAGYAYPGTYGIGNRTSDFYGDAETIQMNFQSEKVCDRIDISEDEDNQRYLFVYCTSLNVTTNEVVEYVELVCDQSVYDEWYSANIDGRLFSVNIVWSQKKGYFEIDKDLEGQTYKTWEPEGDFRYPEL